MAKLPENISVTIQAKGTVIKVPSQKQLEQQFQPYAVELGKLVFAWNQLHEKLAGLFWAITGFKNGAMASAIWYSTDNERTQRKMLRQLAEVVFSGDNKKKDGILWLVKQVDDALAGHRNDAIHAPLNFMTGPFGTVLEPSWYSGSPRAKSLAGKDLMSEFKWYRERADLFATYAAKIHAALLLPDRPWPEIPALPPKPKGHRSGRPAQ